MQKIKSLFSMFIKEIDYFLYNIIIYNILY